jgi:hypothetical protein
LNEHGLNQGINRVWRSLQTLFNSPHGFLIARTIFESSKTFEQIPDKLAFLGRHRVFSSRFKFKCIW